MVSHREKVAKAEVYERPDNALNHHNCNHNHNNYHKRYKNVYRSQIRRRVVYLEGEGRATWKEKCNGLVRNQQPQQNIHNQKII